MCNKKDFSHLVLTGWGLPIVSGLEGGKKSALCCSISRDLSPSLHQLIQSFCCSLWSSVSLSFMSWLCKKCFNLESSGGSAFAVVVVKASYNFDKHKLKYYFNYRVAKCLEPVFQKNLIMFQKYAKQVPLIWLESTSKEVRRRPLHRNPFTIFDNQSFVSKQSTKKFVTTFLSISSPFPSSPLSRIVKLFGNISLFQIS